LPAPAPPEGRSGPVLEIIPPQQKDVRVVGSPHPLRLTRIDDYVRAGLSVEEIVEEIQRKHGVTTIANELRVHLEGEQITKENWKKVRLKPGTTLTFYAVPEKNAMRSIGMIAIAIAAIALPMLAAPLFAGLGTFGAAIATGVLGAAISVGGMMMMNALFPVAKPKLAEEQEKVTRNITHSIGGGRNEADPFGPIPVVFGTHRFSPKYGAQPYTELNGDDQYLRMLFIWGYGPMDVDQVKIGETLLSSFDEVDVQTYFGYDSDPQPTLYPSEVIQEDLNIELVAESEWFTRTTATNVNSISVDFAAPQGIFIYDDEKKAERNTLDVQVEIQYRAVGAGSWSSHANVSFKERTPDVLRRGQRWGVTPGQYEVRVRNIGEEYSSGVNLANTIVWTALRGFRSGSPIRTAKKVAYTAVRIKATGQLNGSVDTLNGIVQARGKCFNGTTWVTNTESSNPADCFAQCLQHPANVKALPDALIDWDSLEEWWAFCNTENFRFNMVQDFRSSVYETLVDIAASGRAAPIVRDGKWGVVWDDASAPIVQHFTPRNSWGFSSTRAYRAYPHAWRVRFLNEDKGYVQDERIVYDDGYNANNSTRFESIEFPGVTDPDLIWKHGRYHIAQARLRPETYTLSVDMEHLMCTRGDRVRVTHDVPLWGLQSARVTAIAGNDITFDEVIFMDAGTSYSVRFRLADGSSLLRTVETVDGETDTLTLTGSGSLPEVGDLAMFGETNNESVVLRVLTIRPQQDFSAQLTLVDDAPEIYDADTSEIPPFDSNVTQPVDPLTLGPTDLRIRESIYQEGGDFVSAVRLSWTVIRFGRTTVFEIQMKDETAQGEWRSVGSVPAPMTSYEILNLPSGIYSFRVRSLFNDNSSSSWTSLESADILGLLQPPGNVTNFNISVIGDLTTLSWDPVTAVNLSHYEIRHSTLLEDVTWGSALPVILHVEGSIVQVPTRPGTYLIKAMTAQGVYSLSAAIIISTIESLANLNIVELLEEGPGFLGAKDDVELSSLILRLAPEPDSSEANVVKPTGIYTFAQEIDLGAVYTSRVTARILASGETTTNVMSAWGSLAALQSLEAADPDNWEVTIQYRATDDNPEYGANLLQMSEQLDNLTYWFQWNLSTTPNATNAPDGTATADKLVENNTSNEHSQIRGNTLPRSWGGCASGFFKKAERDIISIYVRDDTGGGPNGGYYASFNLTTGTVIGGDEWTSPGVYGGAGITDYGNGWYRCWVTGNCYPGGPETASGIAVLYVLGDMTDGNTIYAGDGTSGLYAWGMQFEPVASLSNGPSTYKQTTTAIIDLADYTPPTWTDWINLVVGDIKARALQFRAILEGLVADPTASPPYAVTTPAITGLAVEIDMPDRIDSVKDLVVPTTGLRVAFTPPFKTLKSVTFGHQDLAPGDRADVTNKDETGFDIQFFNSVGGTIERTTDVNAVGYGIED
jgi:hypothetical protein